MMQLILAPSFANNTDALERLYCRKGRETRNDKNRRCLNNAEGIG
jgi:hypothetical protein